ncbi:MAG: hypothetical protein ACM31D_04440 [Bacteroidota bacterium]
MAKRPLYCDACASVTDHLVETADEEGDELALCSRCGRIQSLPHDAAKEPSPAAPASPPFNSRTR